MDEFDREEYKRRLRRHLNQDVALHIIKKSKEMPFLNRYIYKENRTYTPPHIKRSKRYI